MTVARQRMFVMCVESSQGRAIIPRLARDCTGVPPGMSLARSDKPWARVQIPRLLAAFARIDELFLPCPPAAARQICLPQLRGRARLAGGGAPPCPDRQAEFVLGFTSLGRRVRPRRHHARDGLYIAIS